MGALDPDDVSHANPPGPSTPASTLDRALSTHVVEAAHQPECTLSSSGVV
jgi:hypothetical protein